MFELFSGKRGENSMIGTIVSHYKIISKLGAGGMGVVYKAQDLKLDRFVALKFLPPYLSNDVDVKQRFIHEAKAASALQHSNICSIHDIDDAVEDQLFIVMDYYEGETLEEKIKEKRLKKEDAIEIVIQIAQGLQKAHEKEIIHRDIKPANIIITNDGDAKILDFGLAKLKGQTKLTKEGSTLGTVAYMSPEQAKAETVDHRTDIWSVGVLAYELITGELPFKGEYDQVILYSIMNEEPAFMSDVRQDVPEELEKIIRKMLTKNPAHRYDSFIQIISDLKLVKEGKSLKEKRKKILIPKLLVYLTPVTIIIFTILIVLFYPSQSIPFAARDWVLITDFGNFTSEEIFDRSLNTAFTLSINQSSYVNVLSRQRVYESLKRMERVEQAKVDESVGREIALREGVQIMIVPTIAKVGDEYVLTGEIREAGTGNILDSEVLYASGQDEILACLDELGHKIRIHLGESRFAISSQAKPLSLVTTTSLEALKQYTLGIEHHWRSDFENAKNYYEHALKIDTSFVSAKVSLGSLLFEKFDRQRMLQLLNMILVRQLNI
jgi:serine/threonine protein kinase